MKPRPVLILFVLGFLFLTAYPAPGASTPEGQTAIYEFLQERLVKTPPSKAIRIDVWIPSQGTPVATANLPVVNSTTIKLTTGGLTANGQINLVVPLSEIWIAHFENSLNLLTLRLRTP